MDDPMDLPAGERRILVKAVKDNWCVSAKTKQQLINQLTAIAKSRRAGPREKIRAIEALVAASKFDHEVEDEDAAVSTVTVEINVLRSGCTADELEAATKPVATPVAGDQL